MIANCFGIQKGPEQTEDHESRAEQRKPHFSAESCGTSEEEELISGLKPNGNRGSGKLRLMTGQMGWGWHSGKMMRKTWNGRGLVVGGGGVEGNPAAWSEGCTWRRVKDEAGLGRRSVRARVWEARLRSENSVCS